MVVKLKTLTGVEFRSYLYVCKYKHRKGSHVKAVCLGEWLWLNINNTEIWQIRFFFPFALNKKKQVKGKRRVHLCVLWHVVSPIQIWHVCENCLSYLSVPSFFRSMLFHCVTAVWAYWRIVMEESLLWVKLLPPSNKLQYSGVLKTYSYTRIMDPILFLYYIKSPLCWPAKGNLFRFVLLVLLAENFSCLFFWVYML